jgi:uncharacterized repeat protein (TIGR01451 family)
MLDAETAVLVSAGMSRLRARIAVFFIAAATPVATWAVCFCGYGDGVFTLTTINVNGNLDDWAAVHADIDNNVCDGPSGGLTDRDAPVQSTGRDLTHFAYTWDSNNVYLFTERSGSPSNIQSFAYYADIDNDGLMETGEPVIGVTWQGSNRRISVYVFTYVALASSGDPMVDAGGFGDGYSLPGSFADVPTGNDYDRRGPWGSGDGLQMEFWITWAELGIAPGSPFTFHVASSNASLGANSFTSQIDDNLSGCGGLLGSTVVPGTDFRTDLVLSGFASQAVAGVHTLTNTGNTDDSYDFTSSVSGDFTPTVSYYEDTDASGTFTAGDTLLTDTDGDGDPNTGILAPGASVTILVVYDIPGSAAVGETTIVTTTAASDFQPLETDSVADTISIVLQPILVVTKSVETATDPVNNGTNPKAIPGSDVLYTVTISNQGPGTADNNSFELTDTIPGNSCMIVADIAGAGSGPVEFQDGSPSSGLSYSYISLASTTDDLEFSADNGLSFGYLPTVGASDCDTSVTDIRINPTGTFAADIGGGSPEAEFSFLVHVN